MGLGALALFAGAPDAAMALFGSAPQFGMLSFFKYTRSEEAAADLFGVSFMEKTGQSADGNVTFMEKFRYQELMSESRRDPYFRAHPISSDRVSAIAQARQGNLRQGAPADAEEIMQLAMMKAKLVGFIGPANRVALALSGQRPVAARELCARHRRLSRRRHQGRADADRGADRRTNRTIPISRS